MQPCPPTSLLIKSMLVVCLSYLACFSRLLFPATIPRRPGRGEASELPVLLVVRVLLVLWAVAGLWRK